MTAIPQFIDYSPQTPITANWLNDVSQVVYGVLGDTNNLPPTTDTQLLTNLQFTRASTDAVARSVQSKLQDQVCVFDFMTAAQVADVQARTLTLDTTSAIQAAINAAARIYFPAGAYLMNGQVLGAQDKYIFGDGDLRTNFVGNSVNSSFYFNGGFASAGAGALPRISFRDVAFTSNAGGCGLQLLGCMNVTLRNVRFVGGSSDYQLRLEQVFDSYFQEVYFASTTGTKQALLIRSGTADCSNNLRFDNCTFEQLNAGAINSYTETGGVPNYSFAFENCKFERCNISASANPWISMAPLSGSQAHVSIYFNQPIFALDDDTTSLLYTGNNVSQVTFNDVQGTAQTSHAGALFSLTQTVMVKFNGLYLNIPGSVNTSYVPVTLSGTNTGLEAARAFLNNLALYAVTSALGSSTRYSTQVLQASAGALLSFTKPAVNTWSWAVENTGTDGAMTLRSSLLSNALVLQVTAAGRMAAVYGITNQDSVWNGNLFRLGSYNFWVQSTGVLNFKSGVPTSDTDGNSLLMVVAAPATATSAGSPGQIAYTSTFFYVCVATNTWVRTALSSF